MDLRRRLVGYLALLSLGLLLASVAVTLFSLKKDAAAELLASERLARALLAAGDSGQQPAAAKARLQAILDEGPLRHLKLQLRAATTPAETQSAAPTLWLARQLGISSPSSSQRLPVGSSILEITPDPAAEIDEILQDAVRLLITLLFFSGATLLVAWWSADRALKPVRALEAGLQRLAAGEAKAAMPAFALQEFRQVAGAIDQLAEALARSRAAQQQLSRQLIALQEEERRTLARELHDEMGQTLTAINVTAAYLERNAHQLSSASVLSCAQEVRRDVRTSGQQLRAMLQQLRPHGLEGSGLAAALAELVDSWQQRTADINFQLDISAPGVDLPEHLAVVFYRVAQEALTNVVKHSAASQCQVRLQLTADSLLLTISDNGRGLPPVGWAQGSGLLGMSERLAMIGGRLEIGPAMPLTVASELDNRSGIGLRLQASLPLTIVPTEDA